MRRHGRDRGRCPSALEILDLVRAQGVDTALHSDLVPLPARYFAETTFGFIREDKPHLVATALALGRERIIPEMFRQILSKMRISTIQAPTFHYFTITWNATSRSITTSTAPSRCGCWKPCAGMTEKILEAEAAAEELLCARIRFWDGVLETIDAGRGN